MPCSDTHFVPVLDELRERDEAACPDTSVGDNPPPKPKSRNWGGRRPGAGAPKGNLNALKHGRTSKFYEHLIAELADIPEARQALISFAKRQRRARKKAETGAAALLSHLLQRVGEIVLNPENNHLEDNQELLIVLRTAEAALREKLKNHSSSPRSSAKSIKRAGGRRGDGLPRPGVGAPGPTLPGPTNFQISRPLTPNS